MDDDPGATGSPSTAPKPSREEALDRLSSQIGIVLGQSGRVQALTPEAERVFEGRLVAGADFVDLVCSDDRARALTLLTTAPLESESITLRCGHSDGSWRMLTFSSLAAADDELVLAARDVTDGHAARAEIAAHQMLLELLKGRVTLDVVLEAAVRMAYAGAAGPRCALYRVRDAELELVASPGLPPAWIRAASRVAIGDVGTLSGAAIEPVSGRLGELGAEHGLGFGWLVLGPSANRSASDSANHSAGDDEAAPLVGLCVFVGAKRFLTASERSALMRAADLATTAIELDATATSAHDHESLDALTGVLARPGFFGALEVAMRPVTLMLVRVGDIAEVNAHHGYDAGDATLRAVALALQGVIRQRDVVGRLSGATFAVAGPARRAEREIEAWTDRVRDAVQTRLVAGGRVLEPTSRVTHVVGLEGESASDIVVRAEAQLRGTASDLATAENRTSGSSSRDR